MFELRCVITNSDGWGSLVVVGLTCHAESLGSNPNIGTKCEAHFQACLAMTLISLIFVISSYMKN